MSRIRLTRRAALHACYVTHSALWASYQSECGGSYLEEAAFAPEHVLALPPAPTLQGRLKAAVPSWQDTLARAPRDAPNGAPTVLVIAGAALVRVRTLCCVSSRACHSPAPAQRVIELIRELPEFHRGCPVAKLFSKHIKVEEQAATLGTSQVCIGVGTPARLDKLFSMGALSASRLSLVVVDCFRDLKNRTLLDIPETRRDMWLLWRTHLAQRIADGHTRVALAG